MRNYLIADKTSYQQDIVKAQFEMRDQISLLVIQGVNGSKAFTYKAGKQEVADVKRRLDAGESVLALVQHRGFIHVRRVLSTIEVPSDYDLSFAMRWVFQIVGGPQFLNLKYYEDSLRGAVYNG